MYIENWLCCVRKPISFPSGLPHQKERGVLVCVCERLFFHFKNFCRMCVWCSSSLIYLGKIRKRWGRHDVFRIPDTYTKQSVLSCYLW